MIHIKHVMQPTIKSCGQTVLAMVTNTDVHKIIDDINDNRGTSAKQLRDWLHIRSWVTSPPRRYMPDKQRFQLGPLAILRVQWNKKSGRKTHGVGHWSLWARDGVWDPAFSHVGQLTKHPDALLRPSLTRPEEYLVRDGRVISFFQLWAPQ